eukprot:8197942-Pyramimonas_sp.AAC.1
MLEGNSRELRRLALLRVVVGSRVDGWNFALYPHLSVSAVPMQLFPGGSSQKETMTSLRRGCESTRIETTL